MFKYLLKKSNLKKIKQKCFSFNLPSSQTNSNILDNSTFRGKLRQNYNLKIGENISNFTLKKIIPFDEFEMKGFILEHNKTGAYYYHLDSIDTNNTFSIHFTTPAFNNTGIFHILEHLTLCGSKKYPVRDPFMNMLKRSLNSYMNAWTGPDFTMYPYAAQNEKDFRNLRDVYTDATFNPKLDYLDFLQEGWRYEFLDYNMKNTLLYKGVVFNEMKGAMSSQDSYFIQKLQSNLYIESAYKYNSGGEPINIPNLNYNDVITTHNKYYHPSNTRFFSYGDLDFRESLDYLEQNFLQNYDKSERIFVDKSRRLEKPREIIDFYQPEMGIGNSDVAKMAISYLCIDNNKDPYETFKLSVLSHLLMEGPSSTMFKRLIESGLAPTYCHGYGYDNSLKEGVMTIGVQNIENDYKIFKEIEDSINEGLNEAATNGFSYNLIEEVLHLIEYDSKKPRNDFGINFLNISCGFITHSDYPFPVLHVNDYSKMLKNELKEKPVFQNMIKKYLINNNHKLKLVLRPKDDLSVNLNKEEYEKLSQIEKKLNPEEKEKIISDTEKLQEHQNIVQDLNKLPCLKIEDITKTIEKVDYKIFKLAHDIPLYYFDQPTNGISFIRFKVNIKKLPKEFKDFIALYVSVLPKLGTKQTPYEEFQNKLHTNSPGLDVRVESFSDKDNNDTFHEFLIYEFSFLDSNLDKAIKIYEELFSTPDFYDHTNLNQIIKQISVDIANEITNNSLEYSMSYASSGLKEFKRNYESFNSDMSICRLGSDLLRTASPKSILDNVSEKLYLLHNMILRKSTIQCSFNGNKKYLDSINSSLSLLFNSIKNENDIFYEELNEIENQGFKENYMKTIIVSPAAVNECVEVFKIPNYTHEDYPKCVIMTNIISLGMLHKEIREVGGAYGSGVSHSDSGLCVFYSYRDPKPERSYEIFEKSIISIKEGKFTNQDIIDSKIYTFSKVDTIINPSNKGLLYFIRGISDDEKSLFRKRLLDVTREDIISMAEKYFIPQLEEGITSRVVFGSSEKIDFEKINPLDFLSEDYFRERISEE